MSLLPQEGQYYFCQSNTPRAMKKEELMKKALKSGLKGRSYSSVKEALKTAKKNAEINDLIFVGGSTFIVAEVI